MILTAVFCLALTDPQPILKREMNYGSDSGGKKNLRIVLRAGIHGRRAVFGRIDEKEDSEMIQE